MARIKNITFEGGSLTGTDGADSAALAISINSTSPLKNTYDAVATSRGVITEDFTGVATLFVSFYVKVESITPDVTLLNIRNVSSVTLATIVVTGSNIHLEDNVIGQIGASFSYSLNTIYRIGVKYTKGTGSNAILEWYIVAGDGQFESTPTATRSNGTETTDATQVNAGIINVRTATIHIDNIRIDDTEMPTDDVVLVTYNQAITIAKNISSIIIKHMTKPISITAVNVFTIVKQTTQRIITSIANAVLLTNQGNKILSSTLGNVTALGKQINVIIAVILSSIALLHKHISARVIMIVAANTIINTGQLFQQAIMISISAVTTIVKRVDKVIRITAPVLLALVTDIKAFLQSLSSNRRVITLRGNNTSNTIIGKNSKTISIDSNETTSDSLAGNKSKVIIIDSNDEITL